MDEDTIRTSAESFCQALASGDVERATAELSPELRRNLGEVLSLFPLPATEAMVESVDRGGSSYVVVIRMAAEANEVRVQTRWKERDGRPTMVEASHLTRIAMEVARENEAGENS
jgi:hypothetical protein